MTDEEARAAMGMASDAELAALAAATGQEADCLFLELMIRHHEGAIPMADAILELGSEPRVLQVAGQHRGRTDGRDRRDEEHAAATGLHRLSRGPEARSLQ